MSGRRDPGTVRQRFGDVLRSEWAKARTMRSTWYTVLAAVAVGALFGAMFAGAGAREYVTATAAERAEFDPFGMAFRGLFFVQIIFGYLGMRSVTVEYGVRTLPASLVAVPRRGRLLAAKAVVCSVMAFVAGEAAALSVYLTGRAVLTARGVPVYDLGQPGVARAMLGVGILMATMSLFGLALGFLLRATSGGLTVLVAITALIPAMAPTFPAWLASFVVKYWPAQAGGRLVSVREQSGLLAPWTGYAVFCGYVAVALLAAFAIFRRRDA
ncbi:ABC transporter permease [Sphaerisporangium melleum]|nr:ABC transporter permease [Sphaerisporangium melleum]